MFKINLKLDNASKQLIDSLPGKFRDGLSKSLTRAMLFAEGKAKQIFKESGPVLPPPGPLVARTGHLRRNIKSGASGDEGWIGTNVRYGIIHESIGAGKIKALRPFLAPSFKGDNLDKIKDIIIDDIIKEFK